MTGGWMYDKMSDRELEEAIKKWYLDVEESGVKTKDGPLYNQLPGWPDLRDMLTEKAMRFIGIKERK